MSTEVVGWPSRLRSSSRPEPSMTLVAITSAAINLDLTSSTISGEATSSFVITTIGVAPLSQTTTSSRSTRATDNRSAGAAISATSMLAARTCRLPSGSRRSRADQRGATSRTREPSSAIQSPTARPLIPDNSGSSSAVATRTALRSTAVTRAGREPASSAAPSRASTRSVQPKRPRDPNSESDKGTPSQTGGRSRS